ncbi:MAG: peptide chain release factor N(5)-glutamine methyltransferase [Proteobacteria bacterium]|nr:peptide chain release factor N(5)-glutamine methyltransferase [Pseudomonadota bacterium]
MSLQDALVNGRVTLEHCSDSAKHDCEILLSHALSKNSAWLIAHSDSALTGEQKTRFQSYIERRSKGEPVAYIIGHRAFWKHNFHVSPDVLIPRPETELLVELALETAANLAPTVSQLKIADLGTGSGAIAVSLANELAHADIVAADASEAALTIARANSRLVGATNIEFVLSDWFSSLAGYCFNIIVSNPPYVAEKDPHLEQGDLRFEPRCALTAGADGLNDIRQIVKNAKQHLFKNGYLFIEHAYDQGDAVRTLFADAGLCNINTHHDLLSLERVTCGQTP